MLTPFLQTTMRRPASWIKSIETNSWLQNYHWPFLCPFSLLSCQQKLLIYLLGVLPLVLNILVQFQVQVDTGLDCHQQQQKIMLFSNYFNIDFCLFVCPNIPIQGNICANNFFTEIFSKVLGQFASENKLDPQGSELNCLCLIHKIRARYPMP